jgi:hypothetical protein
MSRATTMLNDAVRHEFIEKNPFDGWRKPLKNLTSLTNKARQRFISREDFHSSSNRTGMPIFVCCWLWPGSVVGGLRQNHSRFNGAHRLRTLGDSCSVSKDGTR